MTGKVQAGKIHLILFDIDGTILLSGGAGRRALDEAFEAIYGVAEAMGPVSPHGKTDRLICGEMFRNNLHREGSEEEYGQLMDRYVEALTPAMAESEDFHLLPGVPGLLEALAGRDDVMLGLGTGNIEAGARIKLGRSDLNRYFPFGGFGDDGAERSRLIEEGFRRGEGRAGSQHPTAEIVRWVVGDTWRDVKAARDCGARVAAVATGGDTLEALAETNPDYLFADFSETRRFLSMLNEDGPGGESIR